MILSRNRIVLMLFGLTICVAAYSQETDAKPKEQPEIDRESLAAAFSKKLTGAALVGRFSVEGRNDDKPPSPERYELANVQHLGGDLWLFAARIKYGEHDVTVPITLNVMWAGDTPVITLTDFTIPGMGTFTARVLFYGDRYVGTWQHGKAGGHMWGNIVRDEKSAVGEGDDSKAKAAPSDK